MRKSYITLLIAALLGMSSCQDYFLQKPMGNDVTAKEVFSSKQKAMSAIAQAYSEALRINITFLENDGSNLYGMTSGTLAHISGELNGFRYNWSDPVIISNSGMSASGPWIDNFTFNYTAIRRCYTVIENIGAVPDMSNEEKENVRGEMYALIAYRYCRMLIQYGGVPIVKGIVPFDSPAINRSSVKEVLEYIVDLCDNEALPRLPDKQANDMKGRLTKGAALCIKAQAYLYCARPLFNTNTPYLSGENDKLICMGEPYNKKLWEQARDAAQDVIDWALTDNRHRIIDTDNPFDDYGRAVGAPDSEEVIVSWQAFNARHYDPRQQGGGANNMSYTQLKQYCKQDGTDQTWPEGDRMGFGRRILDQARRDGSPLLGQRGSGRIRCPQQSGQPAVESGCHGQLQHMGRPCEHRAMRSPVQILVPCRHPHLVQFPYLPTGLFLPGIGRGQERTGRR